MVPQRPRQRAKSRSLRPVRSAGTLAEPSLKVEIDAGSPYRRELIWPAQTIAARFGDWS